AHGGDFAERHAGLDHAERTRVHAEKQHALAATGITPEVRLVRRPGVRERIVNVRHGRRESKPAGFVAETLGGLDKSGRRHYRRGWPPEPGRCNWRRAR